MLEDEAEELELGGITEEPVVLPPAAAAAAVPGSIAPGCIVPEDEVEPALGGIIGKPEVFPLPADWLPDCIAESGREH